MPQPRFSAADTGLPNARLCEIHDALTLALDATEGRSPHRWQVPEARGYLRHALRQTQALLGGVQ